jgi:tetratricopeptide (TPR) repeat protein
MSPDIGGSFSARFSLAVLLLLSKTTAGGSDQQLPAELQKVFAGGVGALKSGRLDEAEKAFLTVLGKGGKVAFVHNNLGIVYQQRGDHKKAVSQFREAIRLEPAYAAPRALIGSSLLVLGQIPEATRQLERAARLAPSEPLVREQLAKAYELNADVPSLVEQYRILCEHSPKSPEYAYQLGSAYKKLSEWSYRQIQRQNPRSARIYQTLGQHYLLQGKVELALRAFRQAAEVNPALPEVHLALAQIYLDSGMRAEALQEVERELAIVPESRVALDLKQRLNTDK